MADQTITELTELAAAPASNDVLVIVDVSDTTQSPQGTTKKITVSNLGTSPSVNEKLVVFTTSGGVSTIVKADGVSSITDNADGDWTINFDGNMSDANYGVFINGRGQPTVAFFGMEQHDTPVRTVSAIRIYTLTRNGGGDFVPFGPEYCSVLIKG